MQDVRFSSSFFRYVFMIYILAGCFFVLLIVVVFLPSKILVILIIRTLLIDHRCTFFTDVPSSQSNSSSKKHTEQAKHSKKNNIVQSNRTKYPDGIDSWDKKSQSKISVWIIIGLQERSTFYIPDIGRFRFIQNILAKFLSFKENLYATNPSGSFDSKRRHKIIRKIMVLTSLTGYTWL